METNKDETGKSDAVLSSGNAMPKQRHTLLKWNGWGYNDSRFIVHLNPSTGKHYITFTGDRYKIGGGMVLPHFGEWVQNTLGIDFNEKKPSRLPPAPEDYPPPQENKELMDALRTLGVAVSTAGPDRLFRCHGHTLAEVAALRSPGPLPRMPDVVAWPCNHAEVEAVMKAVEAAGAAMVIFGGGTSVTQAVAVPEEETRTVLALDTSQMCSVLWVDKDNLTACVECGLTGQHLEEALLKYGLTTGHQPDSYEFSSVGGWVATRASGMKKNVYGNIEDLLVSVDFVAPIGTLRRLQGRLAPRVSSGPDLNHIILGSEGTLGVVTNVVLKVRPLPEVCRYGSVVFPHFNAGVAWLRDLARHRCQPASVRLMDNQQFKFGQALKPPSSMLAKLSEGVKKVYLTAIKGFDLSTMCVATLLFEGSSDDVRQQELKVFGLAKDHGGLSAGENNGERGYMLTFVIAYIRDLGMDYGIVAESFETSVPWSKVTVLCSRVKDRIKAECKALGIEHSFVTCRVTQTYDVGACVYFYFAFKHSGLLGHCVSVYEQIEHSAREEILDCGGSISHHHGVGKIRREFLPLTMSAPAVAVLRGLKQHFDPRNTLTAQNIFPPLPAKL